MNAAPLAAETAARPGPTDQGGQRPGRLLGLVRRLIDYGRDLVASLKQQNTPTPSRDLAASFGTFDLAAIIARITRGLAIAAGLEVRLERNPPTWETGKSCAPRSAAARKPQAYHPKKPRPVPPSEAEDDAALLRRMPSAEEIAARIRNRSAGAVIVDICRDLGITAEHPLWHEIQLAILQYGGSTARLMKIQLDRIPGFLAAALQTTWAPPRPGDDGLVTAGAGPP